MYTSTFAFKDNTILVSYIGKKNKCTILQSTMHNSPDIGPEPKKLPDIIKYYNKTKGKRKIYKHHYNNNNKTIF